MAHPTGIPSGPQYERGLPGGHDPPRGTASGRAMHADGRPSAAALEAMFRAYRHTHDRMLRNQLIEAHQHLVTPHVRRYGGRGVARDDVRQGALLALLRAVERFDPEMGVAFSTFARQTIDGELKRLLRDRSWAVRPPRRLQEMYLAVRKAEDTLTQSLGRPPTIKELARMVDTTEDLVLQSLEAGGARQASSLDQPTRDGGSTLHHLLGSSDGSYGRAEARVIVADLLTTLDERERAIVQLRFYEELDQPEIAARLGLSQSYVSRLIRRILDNLQAEMRSAHEFKGEDVATRDTSAPT